MKGERKKKKKKPRLIEQECAGVEEKQCSVETVTSFGATNYRSVEM